MKRILIVLALVLAGCAHSGPALTTSERIALYEEHAGAPVASFNIDRVAGVTRWTPLGDQALAIWNTPNSGYLLGFRSRCTGLSFGSSITISNSLGFTQRTHGQRAAEGGEWIDDFAAVQDIQRPAAGWTCAWRRQA
ncbi:hypothetical protein H1235_09100 [Pseudoxanthomonas sp. NC8]|nr:hypothetical protein H1235_09100 [Pseudoxanthomonas sp. NC8]